ncbi:MAG: VOC family protein [Dehalococcoidia bacterium]
MDYKWIDHVVIAVKDLNEGIATYRDNLGMTLDRTSESQAMGIKQAFFTMGDGRVLEVVEPLGPETPVGRALERRGEGVFIVALAVDDKAKAAQELQDKGVQIIGADQPGGQIFVHPRSTHGVLIQLVERP